MPAIEHQQLLEDGIEHHRGGELDRAAACYSGLLARDPFHTDALHLLGVVASEQGDHETAVRLIRRAADIAPASTYFSNLGLALSRQGSLEEAITSYERALELNPDHVPTLAKLGRTLAASGRVAEARGRIGRALELEPGSPDTHNALGAAVAQEGDWDTAWRSFERALELDPTYEEARANLIKAVNLAAEASFGGEQWTDAERAYRRLVELEPLRGRNRYNLAVCLTAQKRLPEALRCYEHALLLEPDNAEAFHNMALLYQAESQTGQALACYTRALELRPENVDTFYNLGVLLAEVDQTEQARHAYQEVLRLQPGNADVHNNLGGLCLAENRPDEAIAHYQEALRHDPEHREAAWNVGLAHLTLGKFETGWRGYEHRLRQPGFAKRNFAQPRWQGESVKGKRVLVWAEQGLGDTLQFMRYMPLLRERGATVVLECQPRVKPLFECMEDAVEMAAMGEPLPQVDAHIPLLSLPGLFGTREGNVPPPVSGWRLPADRLEKWKRRLQPHTGFKVGLVWGGNVDNYNGRRRSAPLAALASLTQAEGVALFGLQRGPQAAELAGVTGITNLEEEGNDILDTAAIMANLDLIISVDTMAAHLAGTLGRPVWVLLPYGADWRWMLERADTEWYPTMRLFRQSAAGDWEELAGRVKTELERVSLGLARVG